MNIQQLEYLIAVDKYKHFGKAAQACFITQPTLSAMIQKLEEELEVKIFDRSGHPIRTTDMGQPIIEQAYKILDSVNELREKADLLRNVIGGKLTVGIIPTVSSYLLPGQILNFVEKHPKIQLTVREMTTDNVIKALKNGEIDAGIIATPYSEARDMFQDRLFNEELMLYSSEKNNSPDGQFVVPEEIDTENIWLLEEGNCLTTQFEKVCKLQENAHAPKNLTYRAANMHSLVQIVDRLGGISMLPELAAKGLTEEQQQRIYRFRKPFPYREISVVYYRPTFKQKMIDELRDFIRAEVEPQLNFGKNPADFIAIKAD